jgi:hypothetical protein
LSVKAFVVPPLSRQHVPGQDLARRTHAAHPQPPPPARRPGDDDQALTMARSDRQVRRADPWELPSAYISN